MENRNFGRDWQSVSYIPLVSILPFLILIWVFERSAMLFWRQKNFRKEFPANLIPTRAELERDVGDLLQATESIALGVFEEFERLSNRLKLSAVINPQADAIVAAYALIYLHFRRIGFPKGSKALATFAAFRSQMLTNYLVKAQPKFPGLPAMTPEDMKDEELRASGDAILKLYEERGATVQDNLDRNVPYPFFPLLREWATIPWTAGDGRGTQPSFRLAFRIAQRSSAEKR